MINCKYCFTCLEGCNLDQNNFMAATFLRDCLVSLGSTKTRQIEYIEIHYGNTEFLDNVCDAIAPGTKFDLSLTEKQPDRCSSGSKVMYPSHCNEGWLEQDCSNGCGNANYEGFYCTGRLFSELCCTTITIMKSITTSQNNFLL